MNKDSNAHIIYIDDNKNDYLILELAIKKCNLSYSVQYISDGHEAKMFFEGRSGIFPGLILLDLNIPNVDGFDILKTIRESESYNHVPVVMMTNSKHPGDIQKVYKFGANAYIIKPFGRDENLDCICTTINFWLKLNQAPREPFPL